MVWFPEPLLHIIIITIVITPAEVVSKLSLAEITLISRQRLDDGGQ